MATAPVDPVIVVPGITASYLEDAYPLPPETIWSVLNKDYRRASLHPDNLRYEAAEPALVRPGQIYEIAYRELVAELRHNLSARADAPVPVYPFAYDWRQPLESTQERLADFIDEVIERTSLLRHYAKSDYGKGVRARVTLLGHSMGGLVIAGYLADHGAAKVGKVATIATPFQGSCESVIKVTTGTANLGSTPPSSREREAARVTPALYYLLPSYRGNVTKPDGMPNSLFNPGLWQPSVSHSIAEYIRLHGLSQADRPAQAIKIFTAMLRAAHGHRQKVNKLDLEAAGLGKNNWLCLAGADSDTRVKLTVVKRQGKPDFVFNASHDLSNEWASAAEERTRNTGDGTVPLAGAVPKFLDEENVVCLTPDDFGTFELQDRTLARLAGFHGILPNVNMLQRLIVRFLKGAGDTRRNTWGRPLPGVSGDDWNPPFVGVLHNDDDD